MAHVRRVPRKAQTGRARFAYEVRYRDPDHRERVKTFARKLDAVNFAASIETDKQRDEYIDPKLGRVTFGEWSAKWLASKSIQPKTRNGYEDVMRNLVLPAFADQQLAKVRALDVERFFADLRESGVSVSRLRHAKTLLHQIFEAAVRNSYIVRSPVLGVRLPKSQPREMNVLTAEQVDAIGYNLPERYRALVYLLAYGGLRWGEAAALRRGRCNLLRGRIEVTEAVSEVNGVLHYGSTKTHQARSVALPGFLRKLLAEHLTAFTENDPDAFVFTTDNGTPLRNGNFRRRVWVSALDKAELPRTVRIHDLRHTCASLLISKGASIKAVQNHLGHASAAMTLDVYGHMLPDEQDRIAAELDEAFRAARESSAAGSHEHVGDGPD